MKAILFFLLLSTMAIAQKIDNSSIYIVVEECAIRDGSFRFVQLKNDNKSHFTLSWPSDTNYKLLLLKKNADSTIFKQRGGGLGVSRSMKLDSDYPGKILKRSEYCSMFNFDSSRLFKPQPNIIFSSDFILFDHRNLYVMMKNNPIYLVLPSENETYIMYKVIRDYDYR